MDADGGGVLIPDVEKVVGKYLRDNFGLRVVGKTPDNTDDSWVRLTKLGGPQTSEADHLVPFLVQLDCYAGADGGQPEAVTLGLEVRDALRQIGSYAHTGATVSGASVVNDARIPDDDFEPARERVILTANVWAHS